MHYLTTTAVAAVVIFVGWQFRCAWRRYPDSVLAKHETRHWYAFTWALLRWERMPALLIYWVIQKGLHHKFPDTFSRMRLKEMTTRLDKWFYQQSYCPCRQREDIGKGG